MINSKKGQVLPSPLYEAILKTVISLILFVFIIALVVAILLALFSEDSDLTDYGSLKSYTSLVEKINNLDCGGENYCNHTHYHYLAGSRASFTSEITIFNGTSNSYSLKCGDSSHWRDELSTDTCPSLNCICFNGNCKEGEIKNGNLKNIENLKDFAHFYVTLTPSNQGPRYEQCQYNLENNIHYLSGFSHYQHFTDQDGCLISLLRTQSNSLIGLSDVFNLLGRNGLVTNYDSFCENGDRRGESYYFYFKILIEKNEEEISLKIEKPIMTFILQL